MGEVGLVTPPTHLPLRAWNPLGGALAELEALTRAHRGPRDHIKEVRGCIGLDRIPCPH